MLGFKIKTISSDENIANSKRLLKIAIQKRDGKKLNCNINIGDIVELKSNPSLIGKVKSISDNKTLIQWNDNTIERFSELALFNEVKKSDKEFNLKVTTSTTVTKNETTEKVVKRPVKGIKTISTNNISNNVSNNIPGVNSDESDIYSNAFKEMYDEYDDIIDANPNKLKENRINRQISTIETKLENTQIENIKNKAIDEVIDLMNTKNMKFNEADQRKELSGMNDSEFENFKSLILNSEDNISEAELKLQRIKNGEKFMGTFGNSGGHIVESSLDLNNNVRSLSDIKHESRKIEYNDVPHGKLNLEGFKNIEGLTKPLQVTNTQKSLKTQLSDAMSEMDWTIISKKF